MSGSLLDRLSASDAIQNSGLTPSQAQVDGMVEGFVHQATDWKSLAAMAAGGMAYRLGRMGAMSVGVQNFEPLRRIASIGLGLGTEVTAFEMTQRSLSALTGDHANPNLWKWNGRGGLKQGLLSSLVTFGTLKGFGKLAEGQNLILQHGAQDLAMVLGHQLLYKTGLGEKPEGTLAEQILHAEVTNLQIGAGMAVGHSLTGGRLLASERALDFKLRSQDLESVTSSKLKKLLLMNSPLLFPLWMFMAAGGPGGSGGPGSKRIPQDPSNTEEAHFSKEEIDFLALRAVRGDQRARKILEEKKSKEGPDSPYVVAKLDEINRVGKGDALFFEKFIKEADVDRYLELAKTNPNAIVALVILAVLGNRRAEEAMISKKLNIIDLVQEAQTDPDLRDVVEVLAEAGYPEAKRAARQWEDTNRHGLNALAAPGLLGIDMFANGHPTGTGLLLTGLTILASIGGIGGFFSRGAKFLKDLFLEKKEKTDSSEPKRKGFTYRTVPEGPPFAETKVEEGWSNGDKVRIFAAEEESAFSWGIVTLNEVKIPSRQIQFIMARSPLPDVDTSKRIDIHLMACKIALPLEEAQRIGLVQIEKDGSISFDPRKEFQVEKI